MLNIQKINIVKLHSLLKEREQEREENEKCKTFNYPVTNQRALVTRDAFPDVIKATARNNTV